MAFKEGKFYAIQGKTRTGVWRYLENVVTRTDHARKLHEIAKRNGRYAGRIDEYGEEYYRPEDEAKVKESSNPFELKLYPMDHAVADIVKDMRSIRENCGENLSSNSIRIVLVESSVSDYVPEDQSQDQIELRKFALEKLSDFEKELLKVNHWEVYHKLGDRSMLDDENEA